MTWYNGYDGKKKKKKKRRKGIKKIKAMMGDHKTWERQVVRATIE